MKKWNFIVALLLAGGNLVAQAGTWDIMDKSMGNNWNQDEGSTAQAWTSYVGASVKGTTTITPSAEGWVNITKVGVGTTSHSALINSWDMKLGSGNPYTVEIEARVNAVDKVLYPDNNSGYESALLSARINNKQVNISVRHNDGATDVGKSGYACLTETFTVDESERHYLDLSQFHTYSFVLSADHSVYDVYIDYELVFEGVPTIEDTSSSDIVRAGANRNTRCNIDVRHARVGTGDFYSTTKIVSVSLNKTSQMEAETTTVRATVYTAQVSDNEKLLVSLIDENDNTIVPAVEAVVTQNKAVAELIVPSTVKCGTYWIKAAAPGDKIGGVNVAPKTAEYRVLNTAFYGKNLVTFGNSITAASGSWAYRVRDLLGFGHLYNGAVSASIWYEREQRFEDGTVVRTQDYTDPDFAGITSQHYDGMTPEEWQKRVNNCAVVHVQKYLAERKNLPAENQTPDYVVFSYGTNDPVDFRGDAKETLAAEDLSEVDTYTTAGAVRWCIDTMRMVFPQVKIFLCFPLQTSESRGWNANNLIKIEVLKELCEGLSVPYIDCFHESGITTENAADYLPDGLHPNAAGQIMQGEYIARKMEEAMDAVQAGMASPEVLKESVAVSATLLEGGRPLSVQALKDNVSLSEVTLYGISGNEVYRATISDAEYTFQSPIVAGAYILAVSLDDCTEKEFKIIVK